MSPIGRIFIVLNLILSAAFLGWAANALATTEDYKQQLQDERASLGAELLAKEDEVSQLNSQKDRLENDARSFREQRDIGELAGAELFHGNEYPGWNPNFDSDVLATCRGLYAEVFGNEPKISSIHAGLECGIIGRQIAEPMDMISIGPNIQGAHSPDERIWVDSVEKAWTFFVALLAELAKD